MSRWNELLLRFGRGDPKLLLVSSLPLFDGLRLSRLRELTCHLDEVGFTAGEVLMRSGAYQHTFYILIEGEVHVHDDRRGRYTLGRGQWFGEWSMLSRCPAAATAVAWTSGRALVMGHAQFRALKSHQRLLRRLTDQGAAPRTAGSRS